MPLVDRHVARTHAVVFERPGGQRAVAVETAFDDHDVWGRLKRDFDGREEVSVRLPVTSPTGLDEVVDHPLRYAGTLGPKDLHSAVIPEDLGGGRKLNLAALRLWGLAGSAKIRGPASGEEQIWFQGFGENAPIHDVGRVDERGIAWTGGVVAERISRYRSERQPLEDNATLSFRHSELGIPGNLRFALEVYAPGITDLHTGERDFASKARAIEQMGLAVESPFLAGGSRPLSYLGHGGPSGNNFVVGWQLADPENFQSSSGSRIPPSGSYPVRILKGSEVLAQFTLDWQL